MTAASLDTDILIVGAGPVGLFLANECARRGLRWRLVETKASQSEHSKALAIFPRTLEIFDMAGVAGPFLEVANRVTSVAIMAEGRRLAHMQFAPEESPYPFVAMVPQHITEKLLVDELRRRGGAVEYETSFVTAERQDDRVQVILDCRGERVEMTASFVVGCDGAHSTVRHLLNLAFEGEQYDALFMLADIDTNEFLPGGELQLCPSEFGPLAVFPMSATRRRIVATIVDNEKQDDAPSLDFVRRVLRQRAPDGFEALDLHWSSYFRVHHRQVAQLRVGRIFIAGDAAHIHSPFGGQGMNTGLQDIWNLAWKLDFAVRGHGSEALLDSYTAERRPVIKSVIEMTHFMTRALGTPSRLAQTLRNTFIPMVSRLAPFQHGFVQRLSQLGISYLGSPIVEGPGKRFFDDSLRGGNGIGSRFLLIVGRQIDSATQEAAKQLCETSRDFVELRAAQYPGIALVRPDGYITYTADAHDPVTEMTALRSVLARQIS